MTEMPHVFLEAADRMVREAGYLHKGSLFVFDCYVHLCDPPGTVPKPLRWTINRGRTVVAIADLLPFMRGEYERHPRFPLISDHGARAAA